MDRATAIKKLRKLLGPKLGYRVDLKAPTPEERETVQAAITPACAKRNALQEQRDERRRAILAADPEYQRLFAEAKAASDDVSRLGSIARHYKITVGTVSPMFFSVAAEGDSWEHVIAKLTQKKVDA